MEAPAQHLEGIDLALSRAVAGLVGSGTLAACSDNDLLDTLSLAGRLARLIDAVLVEAVGQLHVRCHTTERAERITTRQGCRDGNELVRRVTRCSTRRASELRHAADGVHESTSLTSGGQLPAAYPRLRDALIGGDVTAEGLCGVFRALDDIVPGASTAASTDTTTRLAADHELAAAACGTSPDGQPPASGDELRMQSHAWAMVLNPDGSEPADDIAQRRRGVRLGLTRDGLVSLRGDLLPDVAAGLQRLFDAIENPRTRGPAFVPDAGDNEPMRDADLRTVPQLHHDSLAAIAVAAAGCADTPTLGGAAPTLTVAVDAADLAAGRGYAHIDGCGEPAPISVARHIVCTGRVECTTFDGTGRILAIHVHDRIFTAYQRRAIALRDGGCAIPGCHVRAAWCEVYHVTEAADGGRTHTDNGVLLCWFHHRTLRTSGWHVRMREGIPEILGPRWWDSRQRWRPTNKHPSWARHTAAQRARAPG